MARRKTLPPRRGKQKNRISGHSESRLWIYGVHTVAAALANPARTCARVLACDSDLAERLAANCAARLDSEIELVARDILEAALPDGAVHQGVAALAEPLAPVFLEDICADIRRPTRTRVVVLDQVTDPHNIGAILRSAAAFEARAVIVQDRHTPPVTGVLAKAASGGLELCPLVRVTNLARALENLKQAGAWCIGLDGAAQDPLRGATGGGPAVLVLGAEGGGLRRLTREICDSLVRIPHGGAVASLNVSNAAAIALYEMSLSDETGGRQGGSGAKPLGGLRR